MITKSCWIHVKALGRYIGTFLTNRFLSTAHFHFSASTFIFSVSCFTLWQKKIQMCSNLSSETCFASALTCSEPCWTPKMKIFAKIVNYLRKNIHLRFLIGFWIQLWLGKVLRTVLGITDMYSFKDLVTEIHPLERNLSSRLQIKKNI